MGQYKSYRDTYLDREVAKIEKELIAYKSEQGYGTRQIVSKWTYSDEYNAKTRADLWDSEVYRLIGTVTFVGKNKNKLARGSLSWDLVSIENLRLASFFYGNIAQVDGGEDSNVLKWNVLLAVHYIPVPLGEALDIPHSCPFSVKFRVTANMGGVLTYAE